MTFPEIETLLIDQFGADLQANTQPIQPYLTVPASQLVALCQFLRDDERLFFDLLACITAIDNGPETDTMEVIYNLTSIPYGHDLMLNVRIPRNTQGTTLPSVSSVAHLWRTADWHEREALIWLVFRLPIIQTCAESYYLPIGLVIRSVLTTRNLINTTVSKPSESRHF